MKKSTRLLIFPLIFLVIVLSGCTEKQKTVTVIGENSSNLQAMEALKGKYEEISGVKIEFKPNTIEDAINKPNQDFANKTGLYDVILQYNFALSSFVRNDYVYLLDDLSSKLSDEEKSFEADIFPNTWKEVGYYYKNFSKPSEGLVKVGYPFSANTMLLVYNKEMFEDETQKEAYKKLYSEDLSIPVDWGHFENIAKFFTNAELGTFGVCLQGATGGWIYFEWCNFIFGMEGTVMKKEWGWEGDENTSLELTSPEAIKATKLYTSLKPYNAGNFITVDANEQVRLLKQGKVAMAIIWSDYSYGLVLKENGEFDNRFGFAPIPGNKSMLAGGAYFINKDSKNPVEAFKYIGWLMQKKNQIELLKKGMCSPLISAYDDPEVQKIPYALALKKSLERGVYMLEAGPDSDMINNKITTYLQKIWNADISVEDGLLQAENEIKKERKQIFENLKQHH